jgi:thiol-disulfide isomerase/thioredoxin
MKLNRRNLQTYYGEIPYIKVIFAQFLKKNRMLKKYSWLIFTIIVGGFIIGQYIYKQPKFVNGEKALEFNATLKDQRSFKLSDLKGKYILIDFWGSWCGPCRAQSKDLGALYDKFGKARFENADGFEIVSIGVETNEDRWQRAIIKDGLNWPYHILDKATSLRFFDSPIANLYGVKELPTTYLVNKEGMIMGVNLSFEQIDKLLTNRLIQD